jgi:hypothetical protein
MCNKHKPGQAVKVGISVRTMQTPFFFDMQCNACNRSTSAVPKMLKHRRSFQSCCCWWWNCQQREGGLTPVTTNTPLTLNLNHTTDLPCMQRELTQEPQQTKKTQQPGHLQQHMSLPVQ